MKTQSIELYRPSQKYYLKQNLLWRLSECFEEYHSWRSHGHVNALTDEDILETKDGLARLPNGNIQILCKLRDREFIALARRSGELESGPLDKQTVDRIFQSTGMLRLRASDNGDNLFHDLVRRNCLETLSQCITVCKRKARYCLRHRNKAGETPLDLARRLHKEAIVSLLLESFSD